MCAGPEQHSRGFQYIQYEHNKEWQSFGFPLVASEHNPFSDQYGLMLENGFNGLSRIC